MDGDDCMQFEKTTISEEEKHLDYVISKLPNVPTHSLEAPEPASLKRKFEDPAEMIPIIDPRVAAQHYNQLKLSRELGDIIDDPIFGGRTYMWQCRYISKSKKRCTNVVEGDGYFCFGCQRCNSLDKIAYITKYHERLDAFNGADEDALDSVNAVQKDRLAALNTPAPRPKRNQSNKRR
jgi:hypothetical protein